MSIAHSRHLQPAGRPKSRIATDIMYMRAPADRSEHSSFYDSLFAFRKVYTPDHPVVKKHLEPLMDRYYEDAINLRNGLWRISWFLTPSNTERLALTRARSIVAAVAAVNDFHADNALRHGDHAENIRHRNRAHCFREELPKLFEELAQEMRIPLEKNHFLLEGAA